MEPLDCLHLNKVSLISSLLGVLFLVIILPGSFHNLDIGIRDILVFQQELILRAEIKKTLIKFKGYLSLDVMPN